MVALLMDSISAKTLPILDKLFENGEEERLVDVLHKTEGAPLRRLTLAALSRNIKPAGDTTVSSSESQLLEKFINMNLSNNENDTVSQKINDTLDYIQENGERSILIRSIIRYLSYDRF